MRHIMPDIMILFMAQGMVMGTVGITDTDMGTIILHLDGILGLATDGITGIADGPTTLITGMDITGTVMVMEVIIQLPIIKPKGMWHIITHGEIPTRITATIQELFPVQGRHGFRIIPIQGMSGQAEAMIPIIPL